MISVSVSGLSEAVANLHYMANPKFVKKVSVNLVNSLAAASRKKVIGTLKSGSVFRKPAHRHIISSIRYAPASIYTSISEEDVSYLIIKGKAPSSKFGTFKGAGDYLKVHIKDLNIDTRPFKLLEHDLQRRNILPGYKYAIYSERGNVVSKTRVKTLIARVYKVKKTTITRSRRRKSSRIRKEYFVVRDRKRGLFPGIWLNTRFVYGRPSIKLIYSFHRKAHYSKKPWSFYKEVLDYANESFSRRLDAAFNAALKDNTVNLEFLGK